MVANNGQTQPHDNIILPMVEIFGTVEGEGTKAGFPTTFVRLYNCNLRCRWCDTKYSYAPEKPVFSASVAEIVDRVIELDNAYVCLTGGEPLLYEAQSLHLIEALTSIDAVEDLHVETSGSIDLTPFVAVRNEQSAAANKLRFIMDYKLPSSGEEHHMVMRNFDLLDVQDETKFVIADEQDFHKAVSIMNQWHRKGTVLFSPVWEDMPPARLVELMRQYHLTHVKLSLQLHKIIWDPARRGV